MLPLSLLGRPTASRRRTPARLSCEALEARDVPTLITGTVFDDANGNGTRDGGEPGLAGWTAYADNNRNGVFDPGEASALTDADGIYSLDTVAVLPWVGSTGNQYDVVTLRFETGAGGRWLNTTRVDAPLVLRSIGSAVRDFGARFVSDADAGFQPVGPEQLVNQVTAGEQGHPSTGAGTPPVSVAADAAGNYVVAWLTDVNNVSRTISARVFNADGTARTGEITVAVETGPNGTNIGMPSVTMAATGDRIALAWHTAGVTKARVYKKDGSPVSGAVTVATGYLNGIASDATGNFVVLYHYPSPSNGTPVIKAQRFTAAGAATGNAINIANPNLLNGLASVAMDDSGRFVVAWDDIPQAKKNQPSLSYVYAQRFTASGQKAGSQITVASDANIMWQSNVTVASAGAFAVGWYSRASASFGVQRFNADGTTNGAAVRMGDGTEVQPAMGLDDAGNLTLGWTTRAATQTSNWVFASQLPAGSTTPKAITVVNMTMLGGQRNPGLAVTGNGAFVVAWNGYGPGDDAGTFAQRFIPVSPLTAAGGPATSATTAALTADQLRPIVREAVRRWNQTGLTAAERKLLRSVTVHLAELDGATLGLAAGTTITIDQDAAGYGWFVDRTPRKDTEFTAAGNQGELGRIDLLTAVMHELGHVLSRAHAAGGVMGETLGTGVRLGV